jgi:hypothetical protein
MPLYHGGLFSGYLIRPIAELEKALEPVTKIPALHASSSSTCAS